MCMCVCAVHFRSGKILILAERARLIEHFLCCILFDNLECPKNQSSTFEFTKLVGFKYVKLIKMKRQTYLRLNYPLRKIVLKYLSLIRLSFKINPYSSLKSLF